MTAIRYAERVDESSVVSRIAHESCSRAPSLLAKGHWWEELDRDFARRPEGFDLALVDRLRVGAAALILATISENMKDSIMTTSWVWMALDSVLRETLPRRPM